MSILKSLKKKYLQVKWALFPNYLNNSYSQEGEDILLNRIFYSKSNGFYVDIGAHHPLRFSNTYLFYLKGWKGINVEPRPGSKAVFDSKRSRDITLEVGVSSTPGELTFYQFNDPALSGFSRDLTDERISEGRYKLVAEQKIPVITLEELLDKNLPKNQIIDFLSVDVEGLDIEVLRSNNWSKYRPSYVVVEIIKNELNAAKSDPIHGFMIEQGYELFAKLYYSCVYQDTRNKALFTNSFQ